MVFMEAVRKKQYNLASEIMGSYLEGVKKDEEIKIIPLESVK